MKVVIVSHLLARAIGGGVMMRSIAVAHALAREGLDVHLLGTDAGITPADIAHLAGLRTTLVRSLLPRFVVPLAARGQIGRIVREADVLLLFNHWTLLNVSAWRAARRHGVPHVICPSGALPRGVRSHGIKRVYNALAGQALVRGAARWVATTALERADFATYGVPADRVDVIPNAVDLFDLPRETYERGDHHAGHLYAGSNQPDASEPGTAPPATDDARPIAALRARLGLGEAPLLLFMGRLNPIKGPDLLLEAFARIAGAHPAWRLLFAGRDEGMGPALAARAEALGLGGRVCFAGMLGREESVAAYRAAALLVVPSRSEAMSLVALEAGAQGTPVLMTDVCGFDDVQRIGGGLLVPATAEGIADGLRRLLARAADLPGMGAALRAHVAATYGWLSVAPRWVAVLTEAAGARRDARSRRSSRRTPA